VCENKFRKVRLEIDCKNKFVADGGLVADSVISRMLWNSMAARCTTRLAAQGCEPTAEAARDSNASDARHRPLKTNQRVKNRCIGHRMPCLQSGRIEISE